MARLGLRLFPPEASGKLIGREMHPGMDQMVLDCLLVRGEDGTLRRILRYCTDIKTGFSLIVLTSPTFNSHPSKQLSIGDSELEERRKKQEDNSPHFKVVVKS